MAPALGPGEPHESFTEWAKGRGIDFDSVTPARFVGRGLGVVAQRRLQQGETLVYVPSAALLTIDSSIVRRLKLPHGCTVHGRLAAALTAIFKQTNHELEPWRATWPSVRDFEQSMPLLWDDQLRKILPWRTKAFGITRPAMIIVQQNGPFALAYLVEKQQSKIDRDLQTLGQAVSHADYEDYKYFWLIVNTRCFYWDYPTAKLRNIKKLAPDDCMALLPFADYFNHADMGSDLESDHKGCRILCDRDYAPGEEVYASYGKHSNDFLLAEYGFILEENKWDEVKLDAVILPKLTRTMKNELEGEGFLGNYSLDSQSICHRTQVALRRLVSRDGWLDFASGITDGEREQPAINKAALEILKNYLNDVHNFQAQLARMPSSNPQDLLSRRWSQIEYLISDWCSRHPGL